jgi:chromosome segregation ATPase
MEELTKQIAALNDRIGTLEAAETELQAKLQAAEKERDDLKAAADAHQVEVQAAEIVTRTDKLMAAEVRPGARDKMRDKLTAAETPAAKLALLEAYEGIVEPVTVPAPVLQASAPVPDGEPVSEADKLIQAAEKLAADEKITFAAAMTRLNQTQKEG